MDNSSFADDLIGRHLLLDARNVSIWFQTLEPGEETPSHWHGSVTDNFVVCEGSVSVEAEDGEGGRELATGAHYAVKPGVHHRLRNTGNRRATIVTVQTGGRRDFNLSDSEG